MEKFFSASVLGRREKWTNREDYRQRTITAALSSQATESTQPSSRELGFHLPAVESDPKKREYVIAPALKQKFGWFMLGGVPSIICGPSGANKTTLMYQLLTDQRMGASFFGHETYERSYITLGADRGEADHLEWNACT